MQLDFATLANRSEILIHEGIDTVNFEGDWIWSTSVKEGDKGKRRSKLLSFGSGEDQSKRYEKTCIPRSYKRR